MDNSGVAARRIDAATRSLLDARCTMPRSDSSLARAIAPLVGSLWTLFVVWTVIVAAVWTTGYGDAQLGEQVKNAGLRAALALVLHALDAVWITLGAVNVYLTLARAEGLAVARGWAALVIGVAFVIASASALWHWPLGPVHYPGNFGVKLGPVPLAVPLLWLIVILGARESALALLPRASHARIAVATAILCAITDLNLEPLAWTWRAWWLWYPADLAAPSLPPPQNFATWLLVGGALAWTMRPRSVVPHMAKRPFEPIAALALLNAVCLLTHAVHFLRR